MSSANTTSISMHGDGGDEVEDGVEGDGRDQVWGEVVDELPV